jgi:hypothetical protein
MTLFKERERGSSPTLVAVHYTALSTITLPHHTHSVLYKIKCQYIERVLILAEVTEHLEPSSLIIL